MSDRLAGTKEVAPNHYLKRPPPDIRSMFVDWFEALDGPSIVNQD
jgi:hypothetical protein